LFLLIGQAYPALMLFGGNNENEAAISRESPSGLVRSSSSLNAPLRAWCLRLSSPYQL
jgi:hypothetical protein